MNNRRPFEHNRLCGIIAAFCCALAAFSATAEMEYATPESQGVDSQAILNWIDACEKTFDVESYEGLGMYIGRQRTAASCAVDEKGVFHLHIFFTNTPGHINLEIAPDGKVTGDFFAMNGCKLESK